MPKVLTPDQHKVYWRHRTAGESMRASAAAAGFSLSAAQTIEKKQRDFSRRAVIDTGATEFPTPEPIKYENLSAEAQRAWNDFPYFQRRYFGRKPMNWQEEAAEQVVEWLASPNEEYAVINAPPGVGKTLLFTHDIPAWITVRNRAIRGMMGSITGALAERYSNRLRRTFQRTLPQRARTAELAMGEAYDALATLADDFGRFKPLERELWTASAFVVAQYEDVGEIQEKEPTWSSYGFDQEFIGGRMDFIVWDDLVNPRKQRTIVAKEQLESEYDDLAETRLEPHGVLLLPGQRFSSSDLYRYCADKRIPDVIDEESGEILESTPKYHHVVFPAHFEDRCTPENHRVGAPSYPDGCLLSADRLPWRKLSGIRHNAQNKYEVVYQQRDVDPQLVLVQKDWVYGRGDFPGCVDRDRNRLELPAGLAPPLFSAVSVDPSPTKMWGIEWWIYQPATEFRFLMDLLRRRMEAPDFLQWNPDTNQYSGLLEEWWKTSYDLGVPFTHLIVEINAAQRYLVQYQWFKNWCTLRGVQLVSHTTHKNKSDPDYGLQTVAPQWQFGRIRLPYMVPGRFLSEQLIQEVTTYGSDGTASMTTDLLMAHWFFEFQLPNLYHGDYVPVRQARPSWVNTQPYRGHYRT